MHHSKIEKTENYYFVPEPVPFIIKIQRPTLSDYNHPEKEE
jgi:hypothetical protein